MEIRIGPDGSRIFVTKIGTPEDLLAHPPMPDTLTPEWQAHLIEPYIGLNKDELLDVIAALLFQEGQQKEADGNRAMESFALLTDTRSKLDQTQAQLDAALLREKRLRYFLDLAEQMVNRMQGDHSRVQSTLEHVMAYLLEKEAQLAELRQQPEKVTERVKPVTIPEPNGLGRARFANSLTGVFANVIDFGRKMCGLPDVGKGHII